MISHFCGPIGGWSEGKRHASKTATDKERPRAGNWWAVMAAIETTRFPQIVCLRDAGRWGKEIRMSRVRRTMSSPSDISFSGQAFGELCPTHLAPMQSAMPCCEGQLPLLEMREVAPDSTRVASERTLIAATGSSFWAERMCQSCPLILATVPETSLNDVCEDVSFQCRQMRWEFGHSTSQSPGTRQGGGIGVNEQGKEEAAWGAVCG